MAKELSGLEEFFQLVDEGREGHNIGLSTGSAKLDLYTDGYLPGTTYLIGAASGVGKSSFALYRFVYCPLIAYLNGDSQERDPYWKMFSLEMTRSQVYAKLVSMYIFDNYGEILRFKDIFSRGKDCILSDEHYELLRKCTEFIKVLDQRLDFYEGSLTESIYLKETDEFIKKFGSFEDNVYIPNNPNQILGILVDHFSLVRASNGRTKKEEIDAISRDSVQIRNKTKIVSPIHIAQFNRDSSNQERMKQGIQDPAQNDFKDSGSIYDDSHIVIGLFSPHKYKLATYKKYNIKTLEQCFIGTFLLKSRFGTSDMMIPTGFYGDCSHFVDLPKPENIYDYEKYTSPNWLLEDEVQQLNAELNSVDEIEESDNNCENKYSFTL